MVEADTKNRVANAKRKNLRLVKTVGSLNPSKGSDTKLNQGKLSVDSGRKNDDAGILTANRIRGLVAPRA